MRLLRTNITTFRKERYVEHNTGNYSIQDVWKN